MIGSSSRNGASIRLIVVHTAEGARNAASLESFFNNSDDASSHAIIDDSQTRVILPCSRAAWTLLSGNPVSMNVELCAFASWSRAEWLTHDTMLSLVAAWIRKECDEHGVPCVKITPAQVAAGVAGVCGHVDWTNGMQDGTHWDPGPNFPWDIVMARANGTNTPAESSEELLMALTQYDQELTRNCAKEAAENTRALADMAAQLAFLFQDNHIDGYPFGKIAAMFNDIRALGGVVSEIDKGAGVNVDALAARLKDTLSADVVKALGEKLAK